MDSLCEFSEFWPGGGLEKHSRKFRDSHSDICVLMCSLQFSRIQWLSESRFSVCLSSPQHLSSPNLESWKHCCKCFSLKTLELCFNLNGEKKRLLETMMQKPTFVSYQLLSFPDWSCSYYVTLFRIETNIISLNFQWSMHHGNESQALLTLSVTVPHHHWFRKSNPWLDFSSSLFHVCSIFCLTCLSMAGHHMFCLFLSVI